MAPTKDTSGTSNRGFASMDEQRQREIASEGGRAAHASGNAHEFTSEEARKAGQKGGQAVSENREHMAAIGRRGGESSHGGQRGGGNRGGSSAQHARAGSQSHKNDDSED
jgi:hypothetical protein